MASNPRQLTLLRPPFAGGTLLTISLLVASLLVVSGLTSCSMPTARVYAGYTQMEMDGSLALEPNVGGVSLGTIANDVGQLGLSDASGSPYARVEVGFGMPRLTASAFRFDEEGTGELEADFGDIQVGTTVASSVDITSAKAALTLDLFDTITAGLFRLSPGLALHAMDVEMEVRDTLSLVTEDVDEIVVVPMPFVQAEVDLGMVALTGEIGAIRVDAGDVDGRFVDAEALLRFNPFKFVTGGWVALSHIEFFAGYRYIDLDLEGTADNQDFDTDLDLSGWMIGGGITF